MIFAAAVLMFSLAFCESDRPKTVFGVDVGGAEIIADSDSHGWLGDGERLLELKFSGDSAEAEIAELWRPLPASEKVEAIIWGTEYEQDGEKFGVGPYILSDIPKPQNGWYYFEDRTEPAGGEVSDSAAALYLSPPRNFTLAVYDSDENILYYVDFDS